MVRSCIRKITLVRVSTLVTGNPKNISDQCLRELCVSLSASSPSKFSQTSPSRKQCSGSPPHRSASGCDASAPKMKNQDKQVCHFMLSVNFRPPHPILIRSTKKNYFLITYQTSDCCHGNNDTNHYYRRYPQASPVSWTVKVDMVVVMSCRLISVVYHGFIHG